MAEGLRAIGALPRLVRRILVCTGRSSFRSGAGIEVWRALRFAAKVAGRGHFDEVETLGISDTPARTNALRSGRIDVMNEPDVKTVHLLAREPGLAVAEVIGTRRYNLPMDTTVAPFDDNDVRLALEYAIDHEEIVEKALRGHGLVGNDQPIGPADRYHDAELP